jgi:hypothetical protein
MRVDWLRTALQGATTRKSASQLLHGVRLSPLGTAATTGRLQMIGDEYGAVGGMRIGRGSRSTRRKPAPVSLCPPKIPHDLTWARTPAASTVLPEDCRGSSQSFQVLEITTRSLPVHSSNFIIH